MKLSILVSCVLFFFALRCSTSRNSPGGVYLESSAQLNSKMGNRDSVDGPVLESMQEPEPDYSPSLQSGPQADSNTTYEDSVANAVREGAQEMPALLRLKEGKWYEGGSLHKKTMRDWYAATMANQLATCGDFVTKIRIDSHDRPSSMDEVLPDAVAVRRCITEAGRDRNIDGLQIAEIAVACWLLMHSE